MLSGLLLFDTNTGFGVSVPVVIVAGLLLGAFLLFVVRLAAKARREPVRTGHEELVGAIGEVRVPLGARGTGLRPGGAVAGAGRGWEPAARGR